MLVTFEQHERLNFTSEPPDQSDLNVIDSERDRRSCIDDEIVRLVKKIVKGVGHCQLRNKAKMNLVFPGWVFRQELSSLVFESDRSYYVIAGRQEPST